MNRGIVYQYLLLQFIVLFALGCTRGDKYSVVDAEKKPSRIPVILDTDANNELDDQHAMAYLLFNDSLFNVKGITVNATKSGGNIDQHYIEAKRIIDLCDAGSTALYKGADGDFRTIQPTLNSESYDGKAAVEFIINTARQMEDSLVLMPIGKLTNIALALEKAPDIVDKVKVVWLGSNYPEPGEYNQDNDTTALNYVLNSNVHFEIVTVRYGKTSGSDAVRVTPEEINRKMKGKGPVVSPVSGRHGGEFSSFGDYSINLFSRIDLHGDPPSRALFDVVAVAVLKNPDWGKRLELPAPILLNNEWEERPENPRKIVVWEDFDADAILKDFFSSIE